VDSARLDAYVEQKRQSDTLPPDPKKLAALLVHEGLLTPFQAEQFLAGRSKGFTLGGYQVLQRLGTGGSGMVYLAEHEVMRRRVAIKILPPEVVDEPGVLERFRREAQAVAALDHPNIVRAYDFRQEGSLHFLVMEYVDGTSLQELLDRRGPLPIPRACAYIQQAALGLQHAHEAGLVHRDVKPANLLVDRAGVVKILDLGLARYAPEGESLTKKFDEHAVMGTADYLSPEQALNLHNVDGRADIYSLGATLYALLAGQPPFHEGTVTQKLLWHQMLEPRALAEIRPEVPRDLARVVTRMMAKDPDERWQTPAEVAEALAPWAEGVFPAEAPSSKRLRNGDARDTPSPYVKPRSTRNLKAEAAADSAARRREGHRTSRKLPSAPRDLDVRLKKGELPAGKGWGLVLAVGGAIVALLLTVGGLIALLAMGPQRTIEPEPATRPDQVKKGKPAPAVLKKPLFELPDKVGEIMVLPSHQDAVERVAFLPDGQHLVSAGKDKTLILWDLKTRQRVRTFTGHQDRVTCVCPSSDGSRILSGSADGTARLWVVANGQEEKRYTGHKGPVRAVAFVQNHNQVLTAGDDTRVLVWDRNNPRILKEIIGHKAPVVALAPLLAGRADVLAGSWDRTVRLWNPEDAKEVRAYPGHGGLVSSVALTADANRLLTGCHDSKVRLFETHSTRLLHTFEGHTAPVWAVSIAPDGLRALSAGEDTRINVLDLFHSKPMLSFPGHTKGVTGLSFSPTSRHFASSSLDGTIRVWGSPPAPTVPGR
jgi:serine/threonine protein kinase